jgi:hypothetical protein
MDEGLERRPLRPGLTLDTHPRAGNNAGAGIGTTGTQYRTVCARLTSVSCLHIVSQQELKVENGPQGPKLNPSGPILPKAPGN